MKDELTFFDTNIKHIINELRKLNNTDSQEIQRLPALMERERNTLENAFQHFLYINIDKEFLVRIIRKYHQTLVKLSNLAYAGIPNLLADGLSPNINNPMEAIYLNIVMTIEELIQSIIIESKDLLADELIAPNYYLDLHGNFFKTQFQGLSELLTSKGITISVNEVLRNYYNEFDSQRYQPEIRGNTQFTYRQISYAIKLLSAIQQLTDNEPTSEWTKRIWQTLIRFDFNHDNMLQFAKQYLYMNAIDGKSEAEQYQALSLELKNLRTLETDNRWHYEERHISLKIYAENLITEELYYQNKSFHRQMQELLSKYKDVILVDTSLDELNLWTVINIELTPIFNHKPGEAFDVMKQFFSILYPEESKTHHYHKNLNDFELTTVTRYYSQLLLQSSLLAKHFPDLNKD